MRLGVILFGLLSCGYTTQAQRYTVQSSLVTFYSQAAIEDIKADNRKAMSLLDLSKQEIVFSIPIKDFEFAKSLMKEHFNEKYLESDKYPKSIFQGTFSPIEHTASTEQPVTVTGKLTIHGVTREVEIPGIIQFRVGQIVARSKFKIKLQDYNVKIPQLLWNNIAEEVEVSVEFIYKSL